MQFNFGCATDIGRKRAKNQDSLVSVPEIGLFVVADGMGGHRGGETASAMVVNLVPVRLGHIISRAKDENSDWNPREALVDGLQMANQEIYKKAAEEPSLQGMGTTAISLLFKGNLLTVGHVGDSRCYFFSPESIWQTTRDHSLVQERMRAGLISREEARTDRMKNVITRSVGFAPAVDVEIYEMAVKPGDVFLICSDGLSGMVPDIQIFETVKEWVILGNEPQRAVEELILKANNSGGEDNVSVIIVKVMSTYG